MPPHDPRAYSTGDESPVPLPVCGTRPIVQQQHIWHLYRVISENISEWKCMAFAKVLTPSLEPLPRCKAFLGLGVGGSPAAGVPLPSQFNLALAQEKTDGWLTEAARVSATLGLHSPVLQRCMHMLEEFRSLLPLLNKLGSLQVQNLNCQALLRGGFG